MNLAQALRLSPPLSQLSDGVALAGSGGKSTALFQLARTLSGTGEHPVIVTTSTHLHIDQIKLADSHWIGEKPEDLAGIQEHLKGVMLLTGPITKNRTRGLDNRTLGWLHAACQSFSVPLLIEADGSRQRPVKAPAEYEPAIPDFVKTVLVVAGLSGLGRPLTEEFVHRPDIFSRLGGISIGEVITPEVLVRILAHPAGGLKNIPSQARRMVLLNQADTPKLQSIGGEMAHKLLETYDSGLVGSLEHASIQTFERTAGILLAAGESSRYGQAKQLLDYHGQPFVRSVAKAALAGGLSPVVVVVGANATAVESAVQDLPVIIIHNMDWQAGQSSSIRSGIGALTSQTGAAIFLLADQPQVSPILIRALADTHSLDLAAIVAPLVQERRANPVLFDRVTFPDLLSLTGDVGGRAIFSKHPVTYLPWHDETLLLDVDTPDDYRRLMGEEA